MSKKPMVFETMFNKYTAQDAPKDGATGRVYKVANQEGSIVALKLLKPEVINDQRLKRFKHELEFCKRDVHENIVRVLDEGFINNGNTKVPFYVMPYYAQTLRDLMQSKLLPKDVLPAFAQILNGLDASHKMRITHRDVKPENILNNPKGGRMVISDFGIADFTDEELYSAVETKAADRLANFLYAAPEQRVRGQSVDHRADIFAVGLILNEMFTGNVIQGTGYMTIKDVAADFAFLDPIVEAMASQKPSNRPNSLEEIRREISARSNEWTSQQKLDQLKQRVVPVGEVIEPLAINPPQLIDAKHDGINLILTLDQSVTGDWIQHFHGIGNFNYYSDGTGRPQTFSFQGNKARVRADGNSAQQVITWFKGYLSQATTAYKDALVRQQREQEARERDEIKRKIELEERVKNINKNLRI